MLQIDQPYRIEVEVPATPARIDEQGVFSRDAPMFTQLFRASSLLPEALSVAYERSEADGELVVISAGCSIGAEADSILALHNTARLKGKIALTGYDINPDVLKQASAGEYFLPRYLIYDFEEADIIQNLKRFGFGYDFKNAVKKPGQHGDADYYKVDASPVRAGHNVDFIRRDIANEGVSDGGLERANLVLANNVLYHLMPFPATMALRNLAQEVSDSGVLSIGTTHYADYEREMGSNPYSAVRFSKWLEMAAEILDHEFSMDVVRETEEGFPVMFARA